jgi:UPF0271 protein
MAEERAPLRRACLDMLQQYWPRLVLYAPAGGRLAADAARGGIPCWGEGFLDRAYLTPRQLVPRSDPDCILNPAQFADRIDLLRRTGSIRTRSGDLIRLPAQTWCLHADTPAAPAFAKAARRAFDSKQTRPHARNPPNRFASFRKLENSAPPCIITVRLPR